MDDRQRAREWTFCEEHEIVVKSGVCRLCNGDRALIQVVPKSEFAAIRREALESAAKEAERQIVEYSEIDLLDPTPERLRIARRIRALATPTKPGDETK